MANRRRGPDNRRGGPPATVLERTDNYCFFSHGRYAAIRWEHPTPAAAGRITELVESVHEQQNEQLFFTPIIDPTTTPPDGATREVLMRDYDRVYECAVALRLVILGSSFRETVMRSVLAGVTLAAGLRGKGFAVDKSIPDMIKIAEQTLKIDGEDLITRMIEAELVSAKEAGRG